MVILLTVTIDMAQAAPKPLLTGTDPVSPGASTTLRIHGDADGVIAGAVNSLLQARRGGATTTALEPSNPIVLYTDDECVGPIAATGTAGELEGAGIAVTVPPDSETAFYATQSNGEGLSGCSDGIVYQQVTTPPLAPVFTGVSPASPANDNFPHLSGNAAPNSIVFIYADSSCSGNVVAAGPASAFSGTGIQVQVADNSTIAFYAVATLAGIPSVCSSSAMAYQEVTPTGSPSGEGGGGAVDPPPRGGSGKPPPAPRIRTIPGGVANDATPLITGTAPRATAVRIFGEADCKGPILAKGSAAQFDAGFEVQIVANTTISFYGMSIGADGRESDCSPVPAVYTDDSIAPRTRFTAGPGVKTLKRSVVFRFADVTGGIGTTFVCKLDRRKWRPCHAPLRLRKLGHRRHILRVKAYDAAGNYEKSGVKRRFQVISTL